MNDQAHRSVATRPGQRGPANSGPPPAPGGAGPARTGAARSTRAGIVVAALAASALALAACGSSSSASSTTSPPSNTGTASPSTAANAGSATATVKTATTSLGKILVNSSGMALYTYGPDHGGSQSMCTGACIEAWPPLTVATGTTPSPATGVTGTLGTSKQSDGVDQVTYNGNLLYTFASDSSPGQVTGNGVAGFSVAKAASGAAPTTTTSSGGGGGY